ncbi:hypothetical protein GCM10023149_24390 [Mucilaginibacter gynuensis]|uniref:Response regulator receiver domain-containing protein n=1 Tax=Mucilaginibacter gynuensis TaxID=1302236 RepID=A0ABP8GG01_9SPHI
MKKILIVEDESLVAHHLKLILNGAGYKVSGIADSVPEALSAIEDQKPDLVLLDIHLKGSLNGIDLAKQLTESNIPFVYLSANFQGTLLEEAKSTLPYGFLVKPFREHDLLTTLDVAFYRYRNSQASRQLQEMELDTKVKEIRALNIDIKQKLMAVARTLQPHVPFDYLNIFIRKAGEGIITSLGFYRIGFDEYQLIGDDEFININGLNHQKLLDIYASMPQIARSGLFNARGFSGLYQDNPLTNIIANTYETTSALFFPVLQNESTTIRYEFYNRKDDSYTRQHITLLSRLQYAISNIFEDCHHSPGKTTPQIVVPAEKQISHVGTQDHALRFDGIIARSPSMLSVLDHIAIVAPVDTSVLILGESGTGKEKIAKSVHALSARKLKPLVIVNCAALPANLIESELFGHEKGAFTGAAERRTGKFELAHKGTIFLDEIGEMPLDLQVKLLRALQEHEIERIGGNSPIKIDVRIIAATNRNLEVEMEEGRFRLDLYYRLFVFPIVVPPLKERPEDIVALIESFIGHYAKKYNKAVTGVTPAVLDKLIDYPWPGNVRELENYIDRSVLLSRDKLITEMYLPKYIHQSTVPEPVGRLKTIEENERDYILDVLKKCNGRIRGANGAAEVMGLPPTTLHSKMKRLGIK